MTAWNAGSDSQFEYNLNFGLNESRINWILVERNHLGKNRPKRIRARKVSDENLPIDRETWEEMLPDTGESIAVYPEHQESYWKDSERYGRKKLMRILKRMGNVKTFPDGSKVYYYQPLSRADRRLGR